MLLWCIMYRTMTQQQLRSAKPTGLFKWKHCHNKPNNIWHETGNKAKKVFVRTVCCPQSQRKIKKRLPSTKNCSCRKLQLVDFPPFHSWKAAETTRTPQKQDRLQLRNEQASVLTEHWKQGKGNWSKWQSASYTLSKPEKATLLKRRWLPTS